MKKFLLLLPILLLSACNLNKPQIEVEVISDRVEVAEEEFVCGQDKVKDTDGNEYKTAYFDIDGGHDVSKEGQCWMAENLNVGTNILNPGEEPSDDGVIEKWCMTDDWSADFMEECDWATMGETKKEKCQERYARRNGGLQRSSKEYCNGSSSVSKKGGLYSWQEIMDYNLSDEQGACPDGWKIPNSNEWENLKSNIKKGIDIYTAPKNILSEKVCNNEYIENNGENACKRSIQIADILKDGEFNGERVGTFLYGEKENFFTDKGQIVKYLSLPQRNSNEQVEINLRELYSYGDNRNSFEGFRGSFPLFENFNNISRWVFSVRCVMK